MGGSRAFRVKIERVVRVFAVIAMVDLALLVFLITVDVFGRYLFNVPVPGAFELTELGLAPLTFLGIAYTALGKGHISIDMVVKRAPPRVRCAIDALINLLGIVLFILVAFQGMRMTLHTKESGLTTDFLGIPTYPFWLLVPIGASLLCAVLFSDMLESFSQVKGKLK